jgi:hypothetical protein
MTTFNQYGWPVYLKNRSRRLVVQRMSDKKMHAMHRALWHWIAKHHESTKMEWPGWWAFTRFAEDVASGCFACELGKRRQAEHAGTRSYCSFCPIVAWRAPDLVNFMLCTDMHYGKWRKLYYRVNGFAGDATATEIHMRKIDLRNLANEIAELEWE